MLPTLSVGWTRWRYRLVLSENGVKLLHLLRHQEVCHQVKNASGEALVKMSEQQLSIAKFIASSRFNFSANDENLKVSHILMDIPCIERYVTKWKEAKVVANVQNCEIIYVQFQEDYIVKLKDIEIQLESIVKEQASPNLRDMVSV